VAHSASVADSSDQKNDTSSWPIGGRLLSTGEIVNTRRNNGRRRAARRPLAGTVIGAGEIVAAGSADLADRLAAHGPGAVERELERFVGHARRHRVTPVLLSILADPGQPDVVRERAFGRIGVELERAGLLTEADDARRRVVRDLHDGAQQRLVHAIVTLKLAQRAFDEGHEEAESLIGEALQHAERGNSELRELAHGIHPTALTHRGLRAGVDALVGRIDLPVQVDLPAARLPAEIEASAYFVVAEALTNIMKHSHASHADVTASVKNGALEVDVRDDGIGGADPGGHGLVGMADRVSALGGHLTIDSPAGCGTHVSARFPLPAAGAAAKDR
jgi:signal transduction histidine kinase